MPKLKVVTGEFVIGVFKEFGFSVASQRGSHVKMRRVDVRGARETLTVPNHKELDRGTVVSIFKQALRYIPESELRAHFYTE